MLTRLFPRLISPTTGILLDANENALGPSLDAPSTSAGNGCSNGHSDSEQWDFAELELNRYPDPVQGEIKERFATYRKFKYGKQGTFLGVGSDEIIDLLMRITCKPGEGGDEILGVLQSPTRNDVTTNA